MAVPRASYGLAALAVLGISAALLLRTGGDADRREDPASAPDASVAPPNSPAVEPLPSPPPFRRTEAAATETTPLPPPPSPRSPQQSRTESPWTAPNWFFDTEILPGTMLAEFDPSTLDAQSMEAAGRRLIELETEYARSLFEDDPSIRTRLVDEAEAAYAFGFGAAVLRYESSRAPKFLICNGAEAQPILFLRELFSEMTWSDTWQRAMKDQLAEQNGAQAVQIEPTGDGASYEILLDGVQSGTGWFHVPGSP
jgi:hypothetical protein